MPCLGLRRGPLLAGHPQATVSGGLEQRSGEPEEHLNCGGVRLTVISMEGRWA